MIFQVIFEAVIIAIISDVDLALLGGNTGKFSADSLLTDDVVMDLELLRKFEVMQELTGETLLKSETKSEWFSARFLFFTASPSKGAFYTCVF